MALFDTNGDGYVNFDEFLVGIRVSYPSFDSPVQTWAQPLARIQEANGPHLRFNYLT